METTTIESKSKFDLTEEDRVKFEKEDQKMEQEKAISLDMSQRDNAKQLMSVAKKVKITPMWMSPVKAKELLSTNKGNRGLAKPSVRQYKALMKANKWKIGSFVILDEDGNLIDGQNRLTAIIDSGVTILIMLITGMPRDVFTVIDTGKTRSGGDILKINGLEYEPKKQSQIIKLLMSMSKKRKSANNDQSLKDLGITNQDFLDFTFNHINKDLAKIIEKAAELATEIFQLNDSISQSVLGAYFVLFYLVDSEAAGQFFLKYSTGEELVGTDPILYLRNRLAKSSNEKNRLNLQEKSKLLVLGWNYFITGKLMTGTSISIPKTMPDIWNNKGDSVQFMLMETISNK